MDVYIKIPYQLLRQLADYVEGHQDDIRNQINDFGDLWDILDWIEKFEQ